MATKVALDLRLINRSKLADQAGLHIKTIQEFCTGKRVPQLHTFRLIAKTLGVSLDQLADAVDELDNHPRFPGLMHDPCCRNGHHD